MFAISAVARMLLTNLSLLSAVTPLLAQRELTIDWATRTMANAPARIDSPLQVKVRVIHVNDFLYTYEARIIYEPGAAESVTAGEPREIFRIPSEQDCTKLIGAVVAAHAPFVLVKSADGYYESVRLEKSKVGWAKLSVAWTALQKLPDARSCDGYTEKIAPIEPNVRRLAAVAQGPHEFTADHLLPGDGQYTISVTELYRGEATGNGAWQATFLAGGSQFFLSVGYLLTQLQNRSYDTVDVGRDGDKTVKSLRIQGDGGWRPESAFLMNYKLPWKWAVNEKLGMAISVGPVYRLGAHRTGNTAANWGVFAGASIHLWERLWITPGAHFGEFSDLPLGFSNVRAPVPDGIANPITGVNRSSTRFGIGLTFRAADFKRSASLADFSQNPNPPAASARVAPNPAGARGKAAVGSSCPEAER